MAGIKEACGVFGIYDLDGNGAHKFCSAAEKTVSYGADLRTGRSSDVLYALCASGAAFDRTV